MIALVIHPELRDAPRSLLDPLERFSSDLAERVSPTAVALRGYPAGEELLAMMAAAVAEPRS